MTQKIAVVTGGATGIGAAVAAQLAAAGLMVAVLDVNESAGQAVAKQVGGRFFTCDVADPGAMAATLAAVVQDLGEPTFAHLNAGVMTVAPGADYLAIEAVSLEQYQRIIGINLSGVYNGLKALLPGVRALGGGITVTASIAGFSILPIDPLYATTKAAVIALIRSVAAANADSRVRINAICPGVVATDIVPLAMRTAEIPSMPPEELAAEAVDLLLQGANGEIRVKLPGQPGFPMPPQDLQAVAAAAS